MCRLRNINELLRKCRYSKITLSIKNTIDGNEVKMQV